MENDLIETKKKIGKWIEACIRRIFVINKYYNEKNIK